MKKIIMSGAIVEVYEYEKSISGKGGRLEKKSDVNVEKNYKSREIIRRNNVRRLACSNFDNTSKFITLTFDDKKVKHNIRNIKECNKAFKCFIKRLKYYLKLDDLKYLAVIEFQDKNNRGAIHYHCLINMPFIPLVKLQEIWKLGFVFIENIKNVDNVGAYIVKYMTKENADERLQKEKAYLYSRNLDKPIEQSYFSLNDFKTFADDYSKLGLNNQEPIFKSEYETEMLGKCYYTQYNFNK